VQNNIHREAREWKHGGDIAPFALPKRGQRGRRCLYHNSIIGNIIFIAPIQTPRKFRMIFYNSVMIFVVNIVDEQKQT